MNPYELYELIETEFLRLEELEELASSPEMTEEDQPASADEIS